MFEAAQSTALTTLVCSLPEGCYGNGFVQSSLVWDNVLPARSAHVLYAEVRGTAKAWGCLVSGALVFSLAVSICHLLVCSTACLGRRDDVGSCCSAAVILLDH